jgi:ribosome recycling factor
MKSEFVRDAETRMQKTLEAVRGEFGRIRTGKATAALLDGIKVDYYGSTVPINQVANITVPELRMLAIQPWEKNMLAEIEKAIQKSDLGLNPINDGQSVRIPIPALTEERRKDLVKLVRKQAEEGKIAMRNVRRDVNDHIKKQEKEHEISEDAAHHELDEIQKIIDLYTATDQDEIPPAARPPKKNRSTRRKPD